MQHGTFMIAPAETLPLPSSPGDFERIVGPLWEYLALADRPSRADAIFVFGSQALAVPARAAELYRAGHAPVVLVSGHYGRMTRDVFDKPEALVFRDRLLQQGVPPAAVVTETRAANTLENVLFGLAALRRQGGRRRLRAARGQAVRDAPLRRHFRAAGARRARAVLSAGDRSAAVGRIARRLRSRRAWWPRSTASTATGRQVTSHGRRCPPTVRQAVRRIADAGWGGGSGCGALVTGPGITACGSGFRPTRPEGAVLRRGFPARRALPRAGGRREAAAGQGAEQTCHRRRHPEHRLARRQHLHRHVGPDASADGAHRFGRSQAPRVQSAEHGHEEADGQQVVEQSPARSPSRLHRRRGPCREPRPRRQRGAPPAGSAGRSRRGPRTADRDPARATWPA